MDKQYNINDLARRTGRLASTVRRWEQDGLLTSKRVGDKCYRVNNGMGDALQADQANHCAALNVLARLEDKDINRYTPYRECRRVLLSRSEAQLSVKGLELGAKVRQPSADKSYAPLCATF